MSLAKRPLPGNGIWCTPGLSLSRDGLHACAGFDNYNKHALLYKKDWKHNWLPKFSVKRYQAQLEQLRKEREEDRQFWLAQGRMLVPTHAQLVSTPGKLVEVTLKASTAREELLVCKRLRSEGLFVAGASVAQVACLLSHATTATRALALGIASLNNVVPLVLEGDPLETMQPAG